MSNQTFQQMTGLSCGAACLLVAAKELGVTHLPGHSPDAKFMSGQELALDNACERAIYDVTAGGKETYSLPDGIAKAARLLGLDVTVHMSGCLVPPLLEWKYPQVREACNAMGIEVASGTPTLGEHERMLVAVGIGAGLAGMHWVLYRPDTTYMDPASNKNYTCSLWGMGQLGVFRYTDTGVYVVVGKPGV
jgi:hypothetical protein